MIYEYGSILQKTELFESIAIDDLELMLNCLKATIKRFKKGDILLHAGSKPELIGILLAGRLCIVRDDVDGNRVLLTILNSGGIYGEALCCADADESPISVVAEADSNVLLLRFARVLHTCSKTCRFHSDLFANMLRLIARKNIYLQERMQLIGLKSVRAKVFSYLSSFAEKRGAEFTIPLSRAEMADYLCVDRSALSHELMRMKRDGLLDYRKNDFTLF